MTLFPQSLLAKIATPQNLNNRLSSYLPTLRTKVTVLKGTNARPQILKTAGADPSVSTRTVEGGSDFFLYSDVNSALSEDVARVLARIVSESAGNVQTHVEPDVNPVYNNVDLELGLF